MSLVLDSSATLAWIYEDEHGNVPDLIFDQVTALGAWVPTLCDLRLPMAFAWDSGAAASTLRIGTRRWQI